MHRKVANFWKAISMVLIAASLIYLGALQAKCEETLGTISITCMD